MEFWNHLKDDRPDLGKLGECGSKITNVIVLVDQLWNELMKLN
jgi:PAS domain S-box-containing protein